MPKFKIVIDGHLSEGKPKDIIEMDDHAAGVLLEKGVIVPAEAPKKSVRKATKTTSKRAK